MYVICSLFVIFEQCRDGCFWMAAFGWLLLDGCFWMTTSGWLLLEWLLLTFSLCKTPLGETECLGTSYSLLTGCLSIQFFNSSHHGHLGHLLLPTAHCAEPVWLARRHAAPLVTKCYLPNLYLGKQRVSLGVRGILSMWPHPHT